MAASALITGGTGGLGAAVTRAFLDGGWRVVVPVYDDAERERVPAHERLVLESADLFDPDSAAAVAATAAGDEGAAPLRAVVNLVGGFASGERVHATPVEDFEQQLRMNLRPTYLVCQATLPHLQAAGGGAIVCVSSRVALRPFPGAAGYVVGKAGVLAFVDALAEEYRRDDIRVNAILPSVIDTPLNRRAMPDADHSKWVAPEQIAAVVRFLCEDGSQTISGAHVPVYGRA
ncbi:MAG TPA: SDR family oxidoreductase [Solirubrobacteraceae bacterium]|jgi:NAD(P)-dependent dehydrogenase (short-subunit alcohol dehydrogenase family)|nr:SDR family oxidoreductase [Solirubrobacteraceae bacterium]